LFRPVPRPSDKPVRPSYCPGSIDGLVHAHDQSGFRHYRSRAAGLTAAYELARHGVAPLVLEKDGIVGGISRTEVYKGYHFDMGGHRFFTKNDEVECLWREVMLDDFLRRPRLSRIYYNNRFVHYPLRPLNALTGLGLIESARVAASYVRWKLFHIQGKTPSSNG